MSVATLLALADSRLPTGAHAHSGGIEQAVRTGAVHDLPSLAEVLRRRVTAAGPVAAGMAAAACHAAGDGGRLAELDRETDARLVAPATRTASRVQGRGLARLGRRTWSDPVWARLPEAGHHPVVLGVAAGLGGLTPVQAAHVAAYLLVSGAATAAQRLLSLDPLAVAALTVQLGRTVEVVAEAAARAPGGPVSALGDPWFDLLAETHSQREDRLFAS